MGKNGKILAKTRLNGRVMAREIFFHQCLWVTRFCAKFGRSRIPRTARIHNSLIVLRCMWKEPAPFTTMILCSIWYRLFFKISDIKQREEFVSVGTKDNFAITSKPANQMRLEKHNRWNYYHFFGLGRIRLKNGHYAAHRAVVRSVSSY